MVTKTGRGRGRCWFLRHYPRECKEPAKNLSATPSATYRLATDSYFDKVEIALGVGVHMNSDFSCLYWYKLKVVGDQQCENRLYVKFDYFLGYHKLDCLITPGALCKRRWLNAIWLLGTLSRSNFFLQSPPSTSI